jgi:hypothetical protein
MKRRRRGGIISGTRKANIPRSVAGSGLPGRRPPKGLRSRRRPPVSALPLRPRIGPPPPAFYTLSGSGSGTLGWFPGFLGKAKSRGFSTFRGTKIPKGPPSEGPFVRGILLLPGPLSLPSCPPPSSTFTGGPPPLQLHLILLPCAELPRAGIEKNDPTKAPPAIGNFRRPPPTSPAGAARKLAPKARVRLANGCQSPSHPRSGQRRRRETRPELTPGYAWLARIRVLYPKPPPKSPQPKTSPGLFPGAVSYPAPRRLVCLGPDEAQGPAGTLLGDGPLEPRLTRSARREQFELRQPSR